MNHGKSNQNRTSNKPVLENPTSVQCLETIAVAEFSNWMDEQLNQLVDEYPHWETNRANRKYFGR